MMKGMDEMDKSIHLYATQWGYRVAVLSLSIWTLFNCWQTLQNGVAYHPLPGLIVCLTVCVQGFCQAMFKRRMITGDSEYTEPNMFLRILVGTIILAAIIVLVGTYWIMSA